MGQAPARFRRPLRVNRWLRVIRGARLLNAGMQAADTKAGCRIMCRRSWPSRNRLTTIDLDRLTAGAEAAMERLWDVNGEALELALRLEDVVGSFCVGMAQSPYQVQRYCEHF